MTWDENDLPRRFFGEREPPVGREPSTTMQRGHGHERAGTYEQIRRWRIADGICPRPACGTDLDDNACPRCGWSLTEERMNERVKAKEPAADFLEVYPGALRIPVDEFSPAQVDEEAA